MSTKSVFAPGELSCQLGHIRRFLSTLTVPLQTAPFSSPQSVPLTSPEPSLVLAAYWVHPQSRRHHSKKRACYHSCLLSTSRLPRSVFSTWCLTSLSTRTHTPALPTLGHKLVTNGSLLVPIRCRAALPVCGRWVLTFSGCLSPCPHPTDWQDPHELRDQTQCRGQGQPFQGVMEQWRSGVDKLVQMTR
jgi:hypothetical protein